ncbi:MAG TPA: Do family serine endopeptidase [Pyrinomonadaceae bacterium]
MRIKKLGVIMILAMVVGACNRDNGGGGEYRLATPNTTNPTSTTSNPAVMPVSSYADVVTKVAPAVVTIHASRRVRQPQQFPFIDDPFFRRFFGNPRDSEPRPEQQRLGLGSGVIIDANGYILTNHHVIDGAEEIKVDFSDNRSLDARLVGADPPSDLAVLKVEATNLPVLTLGDSDRMRVGDVVLALGNPLGVGQTVTMGIISAKGRQTGLSNGSFEDFLQTDAPINQGNSGGALVNTNSELIGINSQILSTTGGSIGLGFAIPSNMARTVLEQLINSGRVRRGQLGIVVLRIPSEEAKRMGITQGPGVVVYQVQSGSGADRAGLRTGDVITALNGEGINDPNTFRNKIASTPPGGEITLNVRRDGREQQVRATLGEFTPEAERPRE